MKMALSFGFVALLLTGRGIAQDEASPPYKVKDITPAGYEEFNLFGAAGGQLVGWGRTQFPLPAIGMLWKNHGMSFTTLPVPAGYTAAYVIGTSGTRQAGITYFREINDHACIWEGTTFRDINPYVDGISGATDITGDIVTGYVQRTGVRYHAFLWNLATNTQVDLNPAGVSASWAHAGTATQQGGAVYSASAAVGGSNGHAALWSGTPESYVDLHTDTLIGTSVRGMAVGEQVGEGQTEASDFRALLWHGTAESIVDLTPAGSVASAQDTNGSVQVGWARWPSQFGHAIAWFGSADHYIDLHALLPGYTYSAAFAIDDDGTIYGVAWDGSYHDRVVMWTPVPEPSVALLGFATLLARRRGFYSGRDPVAIVS